jgi:hypothetical protein
MLLIFLLEQLLPMAQNDRGLMHSLLSLAGSHLLNSKDANPKERIEEKTHWHYAKALSILRTNESLTKIGKRDPNSRLDGSAVAQTLILCLKTIVEGNTNGTYLAHLNALQSMLQESIDFSGRDYYDFLYQFLVYHDMSSAITSKRETILADTDRALPNFITEGALSLFGVTPALINSTSKTKQLRGRVRRRRTEELVPYVDFATIVDGRAVDADLKTMTCPFENGSEQYMIWNLYRTAFWL